MKRIAAKKPAGGCAEGLGLEKAEARATVDEALHMLVDRFLSPSMSLDAAPAQDKP